MLDIIGTLHTPGTYDEDGNELTAPTPKPGWHVNSPHLVEGWGQYQIAPESPRRVFAGHPTFCYVFLDEEAFTAAAIEAGLIQPEPAEETADEPADLEPQE